MLQGFAVRRVRRSVAAALLAALLASMAACGDDPASDGPAAEDPTVESYFEALAERDPDQLAEAMDLVVPGSFAEATVTYFVAMMDGALAAGYSVEDVAGHLQEIDGGYRSCQDPSEPDTCTDFTDIVVSGGRVSGFAIDGEDRSDLLVVGSGESIPAGALGDVTLRAAAEQAAPDRLNVVVDITSGSRPSSVDASSAVYRTPDGRQIEASGDSLFGSTDLEPDSTTTVVLVFPDAGIGGEVLLDVVSEDGDTVEVVIPTGD